MSQRMIRVGTNGASSTPKDLAKEGRGEVIDLWEANKTWLTPGYSSYPGEELAFKLWNPGQQMVVPPRWHAISGEYEAK